MKKCNIVKVIAALIAAAGVLALVMYLFRDKLASCPLCGKLFGSDDDDDEEDIFDEDFFEEIDDEEEEKAEETPAEEAPEEKEAPVEEAPELKVRRGYIPLKFHQEVEA